MAVLLNSSPIFKNEKSIKEEIYWNGEETYLKLVIGWILGVIPKTDIRGMDGRFNAEHTWQFGRLNPEGLNCRHML